MEGIPFLCLKERYMHMTSHLCYFEICALFVTFNADLEESSFEVDYDVHSIVLPVTVFICGHKAVL